MTFSEDIHSSLNYSFCWGSLHPRERLHNEVLKCRRNWEIKPKKIVLRHSFGSCSVTSKRSRSRPLKTWFHISADLSSLKQKTFVQTLMIWSTLIADKIGLLVSSGHKYAHSLCRWVFPNIKNNLFMQAYSQSVMCCTRSKFHVFSMIKLMFALMFREVKVAKFFASAFSLGKLLSCNRDCGACLDFVKGDELLRPHFLERSDLRWLPRPLSSGSFSNHRGKPCWRSHFPFQSPVLLVESTFKIRWAVASKYLSVSYIVKMVMIDLVKRWRQSELLQGSLCSLCTVSAEDVS